MQINIFFLFPKIIHYGNSLLWRNKNRMFCLKKVCLLEPGFIVHSGACLQI